jgi:6-phosphogluconolactonase
VFESGFGQNFGMKQNCRILLALTLGAMLPSQLSAEQFLFLTSKDSELVSYAIDAESGALKPHATFDLPGTGGPMAISADGEIVYVESHLKKEGEQRPSAHIATLKNSGGKFEKLHVAPVNLRSPGIYVDATNQVLLGAHYGEGAVSVWRIDKSRNCTGELVDHHVTGEKAHFVTTDPSNRFVYVPHTGANAVFQFSLDPAAGKLTPLDPPTAPGPDSDHRYHEPRHYAHHPTLEMGFTSNESGGGISSWKFNKQTGVLTLNETLNALPAGWEGGSAAADIHITPNGRFVYVSNRDTRKLEEGQKSGCTLAGFEIDLETGGLKPIGHFPTEYFPRACRIDDTGNFFFAAGQKSDKLAVYRINQETGALKRIGTHETGTGPIWILCWTKS